MNFTGERFIPGEGGCQIAYEHLHRYFFALRWAENSEVLDLACGNGYGAALLARRAHHVWAVDIDEGSIRNAHRNWHRENLTFLQGDATQLPFRSGSIDLIVAMEALEHVKDQAQLLREISRVCGSHGILLISTPNKAEYSDARKYANPFHTREFYLDEFVSLLRQYFPFVEVAGQQIRAGSLISTKALTRPCEIFEEPICGKEGTSVEPMYFLAACSPDNPLKQMPARSAYLDSADGLIQEEKREIGRLNDEILALGNWARSLERVIGERDRTLTELQTEKENEIDRRDQAIRDLQSALEHEVGIRDEVVRNLQEEMRTEIADRDKRIEELLNLLHRREKEFDDRGRWALSLQAEVERLVHIRRAVLYRILSRLGLLPK